MGFHLPPTTWPPPASASQHSGSAFSGGGDLSDSPRLPREGPLYHLYGHRDDPSPGLPAFSPGLPAFFVDDATYAGGGVGGGAGGAGASSSYFPLKQPTPGDEPIALSPQIFAALGDSEYISPVAAQQLHYPSASSYVVDAVSSQHYPSPRSDEPVGGGQGDRYFSFASQGSASTAVAPAPRPRNQPEMGRASSDVNLAYPPDGHRAALDSGRQHGAAGGVGSATKAHELADKEVAQATGRTSGPKVLGKPKVAKQYAKRVTANHRPYFLWLVNSLHVALLAASFLVNTSKTGSLVEQLSLNPMIGPSSLTLVGMGARFAPCMRPLAAFNSSLTFPCPVSAGKLTCTLEEFCGFGGFKSGKPDQWLRFVVPIFLHGGIVHLLFNMMFQVRTGMEMERDMGSLRFAAIYMISGVAGNIFGANFAPTKMVSVGASSALFGLIGCLLLDLLQNWKIVQRPAWELAKMLAMIALSFVLGLFPGFDNFAHIGGFLGGFISGLIFLPRIHFGKWDRRWKIAAVAVAVPLLVALYVLALQNFYDKQRPSDSCTWCRYLSCLPVNGWCDAFNSDI